MKHIIIGGVAGGATAAARIRRTDEKAEIFLLEKGKYISYANCGLPYYIGGTIAEREKLFMQTPASFAKRFNIDVRVENEVIGIDTTKKRVEVRRADGSTYTENYDKMLLSPGASPVRPTKLRFVVEIQRSPSARTPIYPPRHGPQVGVLTIAPASINVRIRPSVIASR